MANLAPHTTATSHRESYMGVLEFMSESPVLTFFLACIAGGTIAGCASAFAEAIIWSVRIICSKDKK